jgi:transcriptional regulator with XRE-family HTH domain
MYATAMEIDVEKLKALREDRALSLRELADISGVGHNTIYRIEHGQKTVLPRTVRRLAAALGVEPRELIRTGGGNA